MNINELLEKIQEIVPLNNAFEDDNVGLIIGSGDQEVKNIIVAHDLTLELLEHCDKNDINCVIVYHPPIHRPLDFIRFDNPYTEVVARFIFSNISVISLHTALDVSEGGNADVLSEMFKLDRVEKFAFTNDEYAAGRMGEIKEIQPKEFLSNIESILNTKVLRTNKYFNELNNISRVALLPGSGTSFINEVIGRVDVFVTGDISHHHFLLADISKIGLVQISHISSEIPGIDKFSSELAELIKINLSYHKPIFYG